VVQLLLLLLQTDDDLQSRQQSVLVEFLSADGPSAVRCGRPSHDDEQSLPDAITS